MVGTSVLQNTAAAASTSTVSASVTEEQRLAVSTLMPATSYTHQASAMYEDEGLAGEPEEMDGVESNEDKPQPVERRNRYAHLCPSRFRPLYPPDNFGTVEKGSIFRSAFPQPENYEFLASLKIKTILTLVSTPYPDHYVQFMTKNGIKHYQVNFPPNKGQVRVSQCQISMALSIALDRAAHPILIHCNKGRHRTGCLVGCFRICQGQSYDEIFNEYHTYADPKARLLDETFMESFDKNTVLWLARAHDWAPEDEPHPKKRIKHDSLYQRAG